MKKILFWDNPAAGALFALTFALIGNGLLLLLFHALWLSGIWGWSWRAMWGNQVYWAMIVLPAAMLTIIFYSLFLLLRFIHGFCRKEYSSLRLRNGMWIWLGLWISISIGAIIFSSVAGVVAATFVLLVWGLPLLLLPKIRWWSYCCNAVAWTIGSLLTGIVVQALSQYVMLFACGGGLSTETTSGAQTKPFYQQITDFLQLSGGDWMFVFSVGILLLGAGYLLTAKMFADAGGIRFRKIFSPAVVTLWGLLLVVYAGGFIAAELQQRAAIKEIHALENRFGRPVTAEALGKLYYDGTSTNAAYWDHIKSLSEKDPFTSDFRNFSDLPGEIPEQTFREFEKHFKTCEPAIAEWEQAFASPIPPDNRQFKRGSLIEMQLPQLNLVRQFNRIERWRIEFALREKNIKEALNIYQRMGQANHVLLREANLIGGLVWIACENIRLNALENILSSGLCSENELSMITASLQTTESQVALMHERSLYSEAVFGLDVAAMLEDGILTDGNGNPSRVPSLKMFRYFFPQFWYHWQMDTQRMARTYNVKDLSYINDKNYRQQPLLMSNMLLPSLDTAGKKFHALTARLRAMQGLVEAEKYRLSHGAYPVQMNSLPTDPFSGGPLLYRNGDCKVKVISIKESNDPNQKWLSETDVKLIPAIQIWSVGPDKIDDGGISWDSDNYNNRPDDIRAILHRAPQGR